MVTVFPGFLCSNRRLASKSTAFLLSSIAQWLHHWSSTAWAMPAPADQTHAASSNDRIDPRMEASFSVTVAFSLDRTLCSVKALYISPADRRFIPVEVLILPTPARLA